MCPVGDIDAMADPIETLLRDEDLRMYIAERGRADVRRFDWDVSTTLLEDVLRDCGARRAAISRT